MIKNIVVFIFSIIFFKSHLYSKEIKNLIATEFKNEIKIERVIKIYPSETFKKWEGNYKVILVDKLDNEEFSYVFNEKDSSKDILKGVPSGKRGITTLRILLTIDDPFIFNTLIYI